MSDPVTSTNSTASKPPGHDIFCTPENSDFVSKVPYRSLSRINQEIRLLKILPDSGSGFLECELLPPVSLAKVHKQYLALSYCAGSAKNTKLIQVNGATCNVFANLHHALTTVRHYWETHADQPNFLLWVDQICINQFDLAERSHQVGFMRDIYQNATQTLICLSTFETEGSGMRWLTEMKDMTTLPSKAVRDRLFVGAQSEEFAKGWADFCDVLTSPWWERAWVFQEFIVSTQATFLYGKYAILLWDFIKLTKAICAFTTSTIFTLHPDLHVLRRQVCQTEYALEHIRRSTHQVLNMFFAKKQQPGGEVRPNLKELLLFTQNCKASDERDRVYSILGLADPGYGLVPDYSPENDIEKLLVETTKRIIQFEDSLRVLSYHARSHFVTSQSNSLLPSWVVDWRDSTKLPSQIKRLAVTDRQGSAFTGLSLLAGNPGASFVEAAHPQCADIQTTTLQVWAVFLDTDFQQSCGILDGTTYPGKIRFQGSQKYAIGSYFPVESDHELWLLCGAYEPFLLKKHSYGYRMVMHVECLDIEERNGLKQLAEFVDEKGRIDKRNIIRRRITIF